MALGPPVPPRGTPISVPLSRRKDKPCSRRRARACRVLARGSSQSAPLGLPRQLRKKAIRKDYLGKALTFRGVGPLIGLL